MCEESPHLFPVTMEVWTETRAFDSQAFLFFRVPWGAAAEEGFRSLHSTELLALIANTDVAFVGMAGMASLFPVYWHGHGITIYMFIFWNCTL